MKIIKHKAMVYIGALFLFSSLYAQNSTTDLLEIDNIIKKASEKALSMKSVEYHITQKAKKGRYGYPVIQAIIFQQKDDHVKDVGFGKAMIKVQGTIKERGVTEPFSFSYDGKEFMYARGKEYQLKKISSPSRQTVMSSLQQWLFMLRIFEFTKMKPYRSRWGNFKHKGLEVIDDLSCYRIMSATTIKMSGGRVGNPSDTWWLGEKDFLPKSYSDGVNRKTISIKNINKKYSKSFFSLHKNYAIVNTVTNEEVEEGIKGKYVLRKGIMSPNWTAISQSGKKISSNDLKGKVVFIDFWGTWCHACLQAMPAIEKLHKNYIANKDVVVIGISAEEKRHKGQPKKYFQEKGYTYIHIPHGDHIAKIFKVVAYPTSYIIDQQGKIVDSAFGYTKDDYARWKKVIDAELK